MELGRCRPEESLAHNLFLFYICSVEIHKMFFSSHSSKPCGKPLKLQFSWVHRISKKCWVQCGVQLLQATEFLFLLLACAGFLHQATFFCPSHYSRGTSPECSLHSFVAQYLPLNETSNDATKWTTWQEEMEFSVGPGLSPTVIT